MNLDQNKIPLIFGRRKEKRVSFILGRTASKAPLMGTLELSHSVSPLQARFLAFLDSVSFYAKEEVAASPRLQ